MKTKIFTIMASVALVAAGFSSCSDNWDPDVNTSGSGKGKLRTATLVAEVTNGEKLIKDGAAPDRKKAALSRDVIDLSSYIVTVTPKGGETPVETWTLGSMPELPIFTAGDYTVNVASAEAPEPAGWNCPYFVGEQSFTIEANKITDVEKVVCTLANIRVTVLFKETLVKAAGGDLKVTVTSEAGNSLTFTPETPSTDAGYFASTEDANQTLKVTFTGTVNGTEENFAKALLDVKKGQHRRIIFGLTMNDALSPEEQGVITVDGSPISVDTSVIEEDMTVINNDMEEDVLDPIERPGHEELPEEPGPDQPGPDEPTPPATEVIKFESPTINIEGVNKVNDFAIDPMTPKQEAKVFITSDEGIANLWVTINANPGLKEMLPEMGLDKPFDLAYPVAGDQEDNLTSLGFPLKDQVIGEKNVTFDITTFVPMLLPFADSGSNSFLIRVVDQKGNEKSVTLTFE